MEFNEIRTAIATNGKKYTFKVDKNYYTPEKGNKANVFDIGFEEFKHKKYAVAFTLVTIDKGERCENYFGVPRCVAYNNGWVGYQEFDYFDTKEEAECYVETRKQIVGKTCDDISTFADIFLVENN